MSKLYIVQNVSKNKFVAVKEGEIGYWDLPEGYECNSQDSADILNEALGNFPPEVKAAEMASMFGWDKFDVMVEQFNRIDNDPEPESDDVAYGRGYRSAGPDGP